VKVDLSRSTAGGRGKTNIAVSVVVPAFQADSWIRETLDSIAGSELESDTLEVIVVDDGSTDATAQTARDAIATLGLKGTVIQQRNRGVSAARNTGWHAAQGEWIQFLDADDVIVPEKLPLQLKVGRSEERCGIVYSRWQMLVPKNDTWQRSGPIQDPRLDEPVRGIIEDKWFGYVGPCLVRRRAVEAIGGFDETKSLGEDLDFILRLAIAGWGFRRCDSAEPLYLYRQLAGSLWQRVNRNPEALRGKHATEAAAEAHLRESGVPLSARTRLALADRYVLTYQFCREVDAALARDLLTQIAGLRLRSGPESAPRSVRVLAPVIGLRRALDAHRIFRAYAPSRRP